MCNITRLCVARLIYVWHDSFMFYTTHWCKLWLPPVRLIHVFIWNLTHSCIHMKVDSFIFDMTHPVWYDQFMCNMMTHSCATRLNHVWYDSLLCDIPPSCIHVWHDPFTCKATHSRMTWLPRVRRDSFTRDMTHSCVTCLIRVSLTHSYIDKVPFGIYRASIFLLLGVTLFVDTG